ncbi:hypothetical protein [Chelativorans sp. AA-79]|uniref:hypothetical protein n=1 Tax=Chelativorans sp. AA-79 TaxID=3028735 RepID=UPI0023F89C26|nr:hypothetical protein [Chelativorans sp. AA-79]WEX10714.1 hypothetical protein PVE73_07165 [Chelativorans sp. AA-79]
MAKSVFLKTWRTFATVTAAKEHFARILDSRELYAEGIESDRCVAPSTGIVAPLFAWV